MSCLYLGKSVPSRAQKLQESQSVVCMKHQKKSRKASVTDVGAERADQAEAAGQAEESLSAELVHPWHSCCISIVFFLHFKLFVTGGTSWQCFFFIKLLLFFN